MLKGMISSSTEFEEKHMKNRFLVPAVPQMIGMHPLRDPGLLKGLHICDLIPSSEQTNTEALA